MRTCRWLRNGLLWLAAGAGGADAAWALKCIPKHPLTQDFRVLAQSYATAATAVFVGQLTEVGDGIFDDPGAVAVGRLKVERWFKGGGAPEVQVLLPWGFEPGSRLLVFAQTNPPADRLRQTRNRRRFATGPAAVDPKSPDADIPSLIAEAPCEMLTLPLNMASVSRIPVITDAALSAPTVAWSNEMLKGLEALRAGGSDSRPQLISRGGDINDEVPPANPSKAQPH